MHRYSVDFFLYSGPSGIFGSDGKQNTAKADARDVRIVALSISFHEQTQKPNQQTFSHVCVELMLSN